MSSESIEDYIKNLVDNPELEKDIEKVFDCLDETKDTCFFTAGDFQITSTVNGLNFLGNYSFASMINMLIPDLFTRCMTNYYDDSDPFSKTNSLIRTCPVYSNLLSGESNYVSSTKINSLGIQFFYQKLINPTLIKGFFYYNFTTNFNQVNNIFSRFTSVTERVNTFFISKLNTINYGNYTDPQEIFNELYSENSILVQILKFNKLLNEVLQKNKNGTNICQYFIPYLFIFYCLANNDNNLIPLNTLNSDRTLYGMEYSDLFYIANMRTNLETVFQNLRSNILLGSDATNDQVALFVNYLKNSNIFIIIDLAVEVYNDIISQISQILQKKTIINVAYENELVLLDCLRLYYNYIDNETFLINNSGTEQKISAKYLNDTKKLIKDYIEALELQNPLPEPPSICK